MVAGMWGKKIGMTQVFEGDTMVPVTVIDVGNWIITGIKTKERDGYTAVQIGRLRKRYVNETPSEAWMKNLRRYFSVVREIRAEALPEDIRVGQLASFYANFQTGELVDVSGISKGRGFAGVVKRWRFTGPPATHGHTMGKNPGSLSFMRSQGRVIKGKRLPGHFGVQQHTVRNLNVVNVDQAGPIMLIKGAVPGYNGSLVLVSKHTQ